MTPPSYTCPRCGATSYNPNDLRERYCGRCHLFLNPPPPSDVAIPVWEGIIEPILRAMHADDALLARAVFDAPDPRAKAKLLRDYYHDADRADRTPRPMLYLHLGLLAGVVEWLCSLDGQVH